MAFKRSAVRLRLTPPLKILSCSNYSVADFRGEVTPVAQGKHQESTLILSLVGEALRPCLWLIAIVCKSPTRFCANVNANANCWQFHVTKIEASHEQVPYHDQCCSLRRFLLGPEQGQRQLQDYDLLPRSPAVFRRVFAPRCG